MDGTLSWVPFVVQTITMARNVHRRRYRMGEGYREKEDGTVIENYWERIKDEEPEQVGGKKRKPYRIELVGVVCDAYLAVVRGIRSYSTFQFNSVTNYNSSIEMKMDSTWRLTTKFECEQESYHVQKSSENKVTVEIPQEIC